MIKRTSLALALATLTVNYYTSTINSCATVQNTYSVNASYLITPSGGTYSSNTHQ